MFASTLLIKNAYVKNRLLNSLASQFTAAAAAANNSGSAGAAPFDNYHVVQSAGASPRDAYEDYYGQFSSTTSDAAAATTHRRPHAPVAVVVDDNTTNDDSDDNDSFSMRAPQNYSDFAPHPSRSRQQQHEQDALWYSATTPLLDLLPLSSMSTTTSSAAFGLRPTLDIAANVTSSNNNDSALYYPNHNQLLPVDDVNVPVHDAGSSAGAEWAAIFLLLFPIATIFGNTLVILAVNRTQALQNATNYFIVSLAFADVLVASIVMPFAIYVTFTNMAWTLGDVVCDLWIAADVVASTASILNLVAIAVDRLMAVKKPIKYAQQLRTRRIAITILLVWSLSVCVGIPIMAGFNTPPAGQARPENDCSFYNANYIIMSGCISFWTPTVLLFAIYWYIFSTLKRRSSEMRAKMHQPQTKQQLQQQHQPTPPPKPPTKNEKRAAAVAASAAAQQKKSSSALAIKPRLPSSTTPTTTTSSSATDVIPPAPAIAPPKQPPPLLKQHEQQQPVPLALKTSPKPPSTTETVAPLISTSITTNNSSSCCTTTSTTNNTLGSSSGGGGGGMVIATAANELLQPSSAPPIIKPPPSPPADDTSSSITSRLLLINSSTPLYNHNPAVKPSEASMQFISALTTSTSSSCALHRLARHRHKYPTTATHQHSAATDPVWVPIVCDYSNNNRYSSSPAGGGGGDSDQSDDAVAKMSFLDNSAFHIEHVEGFVYFSTGIACVRACVCDVSFVVCASGVIRIFCQTRHALFWLPQISVYIERRQIRRFDVARAQ